MRPLQLLQRLKVTGHYPDYITITLLPEEFELSLTLTLIYIYLNNGSNVMVVLVAASPGALSDGRHWGPVDLSGHCR